MYADTKAELVSMVNESPGSPPFIHECELGIKIGGIELDKGVDEQSEDKDKTQYWFGEKKVHVSTHAPLDDINKWCFKWGSSVTPVGISLIGGEARLLFPHFEHGSVADLLGQRSITLDEVLALTQSVLRRLSEPPFNYIIGGSPGENYDAEQATERTQTSTNQTAPSFVESAYKLLHPSQIMLGTTFEPHLNFAIRRKNFKRFEALCPPERKKNPQMGNSEKELVYGTGVLLYSLLAGSVPQELNFVHPSEFGVSLDFSKPNEFEHHGKGRVVIELVALIRNCLRSNPDLRPTLKKCNDSVGWVMELSRTINAGTEVPEYGLAAWSNKYSKNTFLHISGEEMKDRLPGAARLRRSLSF